MKALRLDILCLLLCLLLACAPAATAEGISFATTEEEGLLAAPVDGAVGELGESDLWTEDIARDVAAAEQTAEARELESLCTRAQFNAWFEAAEERALQADHLAGPGGDVNTQDYTLVLPGESVAVLPSYTLDNDGEYSIQGGIMAFNFTIYQFDESKATSENRFGRNMLPRSSLPARPRLTAVETKTMPIPYGARIGLKEVVDGSINDVTYTSWYVNDTDLPILMSKGNYLGTASDAGMMLGIGGSYGQYSFQGDGRIYHGPTLLFIENEYLISSDTSEFKSGELIWYDDAPTFPIRLRVEDKANTYKLPRLLRKGYEFIQWYPMENYSWFWGYFATNGTPTYSDAFGCYSTKLNKETVSFTLNMAKAVREYNNSKNDGNFGNDYVEYGIADVVMHPIFNPPTTDDDCLTLGFDPRGGKVKGQDYYLCETKGTARKFSVNIGKIVPVREGYAFRGWCTDPKDPEGTLIKDTDPEQSRDWRKKGHTELYAVWKSKARTSIKKAKVTGLKDQTYTGKAFTPAPTVKLNGKKLVKGTDYKLSYKNNRKVGTATVTVKGIGSYKDSVSRTFAINPKAVKLSKLIAGKGRLKVQWKKSEGAGYQLQYGVKSSFADAKTATVDSARTTGTVLKNLKSNKVYYVRIRGWKKVGGVTYVSSWSKALKKKVK